jgi:hypothetical protein
VGLEVAVPAEGTPVLAVSEPLPVTTKVGEPVDSSAPDVGLDVVVEVADGLAVVSFPVVGLLLEPEGALVSSP